MTLILLAGAAVGLGVLLLGLVFYQPKANPAATLARLDQERGRARQERITAASFDPRQLRESKSLRKFGGRLRGILDGIGLDLGGLRSDLSLLNRTLEAHLAVTVLAALGGFLLPIVVDVLLVVFGTGYGFTTSFGAGVLVALIAAAVPTLQVRSRAADRRRDFRHVVGSFLDLVAMNLAGGRGVPEALSAAAGLSDGWAMTRIRDTLLTARLHGVTPWAALGELGDEIRIEELRDLAAALALVAEDGAKVRESLAARASSLRRRELAEVEGKAGERSQSMLVAQLLLCLGFLIFLLYPALVSVLEGA
ncbi:type II secretion system F family protein [Phytoactinopolyspora halotolerans]|uniref:Type II secretion protein F n=1 Tax=Phytoactinopolyspora halotolerans TaxID=1981512 RepID=A0A6L9SCN8_9ACTN|nr:type II secretion system F family protein [Phytoactinopolyspora halotolerans]NEE02779.1 type II secretion protein F [Phytoactinopolyspora halotolerans]